MTDKKLMQQNDGRDYEEFVRATVQFFLKKIPACNIISVEKRKFLVGLSGVEREFDIVFELKDDDKTLTMIVECKDYNRPVSIEKLDALMGKISDFPGVIPVLATSQGYQQGCLEKAKFYNIDILEIRKENEELDWIAPDGTPYMAELKNSIGNISITIHKPQVSAILEDHNNNVKLMFTPDSVKTVPPTGKRKRTVQRKNGFSKQ